VYIRSRCGTSTERSKDVSRKGTSKRLPLNVAIRSLSRNCSRRAPAVRSSPRTSVVVSPPRWKVTVVTRSRCWLSPVVSMSKKVVVSAKFS
jgi:hypothetical protein